MEKIQLSNFQKHLRSKNCSHMRVKTRITDQQKQVHVQQSANALSSSTSVILDGPPTVEQQSDLPISTLTGPSSITNTHSSHTQRSLSQVDTRKRNQSFSQSSSHKKRTRT